MNNLTLIEWQTQTLESRTLSLEYSLVDGIFPPEKIAKRIEKVVKAKLKQKKGHWDVSVTIDKVGEYFSEKDLLGDLYGIVFLPKIIVQIMQLKR